MAERPRSIWIGTDTPFVLEEFRNDKTGQLIEGIINGTCMLYSGKDNSLISSIPLIELVDEPGSYEVLIPDTQTGLSEGLAIRMEFRIAGGTGLNLRIDAKAIARVMKDDGL